jgi:hypothetical protein
MALSSKSRFLRGARERVVCKFFRRCFFLASSSATGAGAAQQNGDGILEEEGPVPNMDNITSNKSNQAGVGVGKCRQRLDRVLLILVLILLPCCDFSICNDGTDDESDILRLEYTQQTPVHKSNNADGEIEQDRNLQQQTSMRR